MGAQGEPQSAAPKRWKAFLAYAHNDSADYIKNFYDVFTRELERLHVGTPEKIFPGCREKRQGW